MELKPPHFPIRVCVWEMLLLLATSQPSLWLYKLPWKEKNCELPKTKGT